MGSFQYRSRNADAAKEIAEGNTSKYYGYIKAGIKIWTPKRDLHRIRVLPPTYPDPRSFGMRVTVHQNIGPEERTLICRQAMLNEPDPVEERLSEARREGKADESWAWKLKAKVRVPTWIIDRDDMDAGPQIWPMAEQTDAALNRASISSRTSALIEIEHPDNGYDMEVETVKKEGKKGGEYTVYEFQRMERKSYISDNQEEQDEWLEFIAENSIDKLLVYNTYDEIVEALGEASYGGGGSSRGADRGGSTRSERRGSSRRDSGRSRREADDDGPTGDEMPDWARTAADDDDDSMPTSRRRGGREREPEPEPESRSRSRSRDDEPEEMPRSRRRSSERDEEPTRERSRGRDEEPRERSRERDEEPRSRSRSREPEPEPEEAPRSRSRSRSREPEPEPEERSVGRDPERDRAAYDDREPEPEEAPRSRSRRRMPPAKSSDRDEEHRGSAPVDEPEEAPRGRSRRRMPPPADDAPNLADDVGDEGLPDEPPTRRRRRG